ncbi:MAG TPA: hypothetical protein VFE24_00350 [Pirellulales bacterium]|jgi:hypothetical protein|nr:hypothetical protein [Pirellulales bacterium]
MARKVLNRRELREENDAAEEREMEESEGDEDEGSEDAAPKKKAKKAPAKRKSRSKTPKIIRLKAFWGVFNQSMKRVALFEYSQRKHADKKAAELSVSQKTPHFVQVVKEPIEE